MMSYRYPSQLNECKENWKGVGVIRFVKVRFSACILGTKITCCFKHYISHFGHEIQMILPVPSHNKKRLMFMTSNFHVVFMQAENLTLTNLITPLAKSYAV